MIPMLDLRWAALCAASESAVPLEQRYILGVVFNRRRTGYRGKRTLKEVVLDPKQFSHFNAWDGEATIFEYYMLGSTATRQRLTRPLDKEFWPALDLALEVSEINASALRLEAHPARLLEVSARDGSTDRLSPLVRHFYAPRSMRPAGSRPAWASTASRLWTPEGVDPDRLVLAEGVA